MKEPKVSVIMSVYNGMPYLKEAAESILDQTYKDIEFIIVDDASTDSSWKYLKFLNDKRVKLIKNKRNLGLAKSLNTALRQARGDFVARMDADDISMRTRLADQVKFLEKNPEIDICGTWAKLIDHKGNVIGEKKYPTDKNELIKVMPLYNPIIHSTLMVRKKVFTALKGYNPAYDYAEDYELLARAAKKFAMGNIDEFTLKLRVGINRRSTKQMAKLDEMDLKIKRRLLKEELSVITLFAVIKKIITVYLFPINLKLQIAKFLKRA